MTTHPTRTIRRRSADHTTRGARWSATARHLVVSAALATIALASPSTARGQQQQRQLRQQLDAVPIAVSASATARANALDARAAAYELSFSDVSQLRRAAELHEQAARLRAPGDSLGTASLRLAAFGRYYAGELDAAGDLMVAAAERAAATGDVVRAVDMFMDAAAISVELGQARHAIALVRKATMLTRSPLLSPMQRQKLLARVATGSPRPAVVTAAGVARR